jgi:hypothetical protein
MYALLLLIAAILFVASMSMLIWTRKHIQAIEHQIQTQRISAHVEDEITALNLASIGLGSRFLKLEKELQTLSAHVDEVHSQMQSNTPYAQAINLAQQGASAEDIIELCHISCNEAELLIMMHKKDQAA